MKQKTFIFRRQQEEILSRLGEQIKLARLRRKISLRSMAERVGIAVSTLSNIESGSPSVALGNYLLVLSVLGLESDLLLVASQDPMGRQIQDAGLVVKKRSPKQSKGNDLLDQIIYKETEEEPKFE